MKRSSLRMLLTGVCLATMFFMVLAGDACRQLRGQAAIDDPPPAVVRICGENGNGITVPRGTEESWMPFLEAQGCFPQDIHTVELNKEWSFMFGYRVLVGE